MNVILIVCDTWRRDHCGAYGSAAIHTPNIDRFASGATVFENAYMGSYPTLPCRREIATGRYEFPWRGWGGLEPHDATIGGAVNEAGKVSYFITDVYHHWRALGQNYWAPFTGFDLVRGQERDPYVTDADIEFEPRAHDYPPHNHPDQEHFRNCQFIRRNEEDWFAPQVFRRAMRWLEHNRAHEDFFLMIDAFDPHEPWDPPRHYVELYDKTPGVRELVVAPYGPVSENLTPEELRRVQALYAGEVTLVDHWLGMLFERIGRLGLWDDTLVILTTDHGTHNGDHGRTGKNYVLWNEIARVPLIVRHPRLGHGRRARQIVQPVDYFPTIAEAVGVAPPEGLHGASLLPLLEDPEGAAPIRDFAFYGEFGYAMYLANEDWTYAAGIDPDNDELNIYTQIFCKWSEFGKDQINGGRRRVGAGNLAKSRDERSATRLYDTREDPGEEKNIADANPEKVREFQERLRARLEGLEAPAELRKRFRLG